MRRPTKHNQTRQFPISLRILRPVVVTETQRKGKWSMNACVTRGVTLNTLKHIKAPTRRAVRLNPSPVDFLNGFVVVYLFNVVVVVVLRVRVTLVSPW